MSKNNDKKPKPMPSADRLTAPPKAKAPSLPAGLTYLAPYPEHAGGGYFCEADVSLWYNRRPDWNPKSRTNFDDPKSKLVHLFKSMDAHGLCQPPIVNRQHIVDGNRRFLVAFLLKWLSIPVIYRPKATPSTFADMTATQKQHTSCEKAETWLVCPAAVTHGMNKKFSDAVAVLGRDTFEWVTLVKREAVLSMLGFARKAYSYCGTLVPEKEFLRKAVEVQARFGDQQEMKLWVQKDKGASALLELVMAGRSLKPHAA